MADPAAPPSRRPRRATAAPWVRVVAASLCLAAVGVIALLWSTSGGRSSSNFTRWLRDDLHLPQNVVACVDEHLDAGPLDRGAIQRAAPENLRRDGIAALAPGHRQLVGDVLIACSVEPNRGGAGGP